MSVLRRAHELARELERSTAVTEWRAAEGRLQDDDEAMGILDVYEQVQVRVEAARTAGRPLSPAEEQDLKAVTDRMAANPTIREVMRARARLNDVLSTVQEIIHIAVHGKPSQTEICPEAKPEEPLINL